MFVGCVDLRPVPKHNEYNAVLVFVSVQAVLCFQQVSQWHPRPHEGGGDGLAETVPQSRDSVSKR